MTDTPPPSTDPADDDLLASLYLDGEATVDERARVEANPDLLARVRAFEALADDLSSVAPPPDLARMQISAALDLFDQQRAPAAPQAVAPQGVTSLSERRERKQSRRVPTWLSAAAALALVVGGIGFASTLGGGDDDASTTDAAMDSADDTSASGANRTFEESAATTMADTEAEAAELAPAAAEDAMEESDGDAEELTEEAMADDAGESDDAADAPLEDDGGADDETAPGPTPLDGLDASTAAEYLDLLSDQRLRPIDGSPCAGSPLVDGLFGVDSFIAVVFEGEISSLLVQAGVPSTAVIVGPTCEIELE